MPMPMLSTVLWWIVLGMLLGWLGSWMFNRTLRTRVAERVERAAAASIAVDASIAADASTAARVGPAPALRTADPDVASAPSAAPAAADVPAESATRDEWPATIDGPAASSEEPSASTEVSSASSDLPPASSEVPPASMTPIDPHPTEAPTAAAEAPEHADFDLAAAVRAGLSPRHPDDLEVIDGIGARIAALLRDEGVTTWRALADSSPERLRDLLDLGGPGFRIADPTSWPVQAALAAEGRWADLKALQGLLAAGRG